MTSKEIILQVVVPIVVASIAFFGGAWQTRRRLSAWDRLRDDLQLLSNRLQLQKDMNDTPDEFEGRDKLLQLLNDIDQRISSLTKRNKVAHYVEIAREVLYLFSILILAAGLIRLGGGLYWIALFLSVGLTVTSEAFLAAVDSLGPLLAVIGAVMAWFGWQGIRTLPERFFPDQLSSTTEDPSSSSDQSA